MGKADREAMVLRNGRLWLLIVYVVSVPIVAHSASFIMETSPGPGAVRPGTPVSLRLWLGLDYPEEPVLDVQIGGNVLNGVGPFTFDQVPLVASPENEFALMRVPWSLSSTVGTPSWADFLTVQAAPQDITLENTAYLTEFGFNNRGGTAFPLGTIHFVAGSQPGSISIQLPLPEEVNGSSSFICVYGDVFHSVPCAIDVRPGMTIDTGLRITSDISSPATCVVGILALLLRRKTLARISQC